MLVLERNEFILKPRTTPVFKELSAGISIMYERPRIGLAVIVKTINGLGTYGFVVVLPLFLLDKHFTLEEWASIWGLPLSLTRSSTLSLAGWAIKLVSPNHPDFWQHPDRCRYADCLLGADDMGHNYVAFMLAMCLWGAGLAGFVPMTPLVPMMAPDKKGRRTRP